MDITASLFSSANEISTQSVDLSLNNKTGAFLKSNDKMSDLEKLPLDVQSNNANLLPQDGKTLPEQNNQVGLFGELLKDSLIKIQDENALNHSDELEKSELQIVDEIDEPTININEFLYSNARQTSDASLIGKKTVQNDRDIMVNDLKPNLMKEQTMLHGPSEDTISLAMRDQAKNQNSSDKDINEKTLGDLSLKLALKESGMNDVNKYSEQKFSEEQNSEDSSFELLQENIVKNNHNNGLEIKEEINKALLANNLSLQEKNIENEVIMNGVDPEKNEAHPINEENQINTQSIANANELPKKISIASSQVNGEGFIAKESFEQDLSQQIQFMINSKENSATVNIDPPELGNIEIKIVQEAGKTHIVFLTHIEQTQDLIESNLSKLRVQMESHGLHLGDVSVFNGNENNQQSHNAKTNYPTAHFINDNIDDSDKVIPRSSLSMLDLYA